MKLCCHPPLRWPNGATFVLEQVRIWTAAGGAAAEPVNSGEQQSITCTLVRMATHHVVINFGS